MLAVRGQLHLDARHRAAHARRPRHRAQGRQARLVQEAGEAVQVISDQGFREVKLNTKGVYLAVNFRIEFLNYKYELVK